MDKWCHMGQSDRNRKWEDGGLTELSYDGRPRRKNLWFSSFISYWINQCSYWYVVLFFWFCSIDTNLWCHQFFFQMGKHQHYLSRNALAPGWRSSKKINKFWKWLKLAKTIRFGFIALFYIWEPWDVCWFSSDFHKMSIANHLLTKWNWMLWLVTDLRKTSWNSFIWVLKHHAIGNAVPWLQSKQTLSV